MPIDSVSEYRKLLDYNGVVLAARYDGDGLFTFANWQYTYNKATVSLEHYFHKNHYSEAKADFLCRSGLADRSTTFQADELAVLREIVLFRMMHDSELQLNEREELDRVLHRVDALLPPTDNQLPAAEIEMGQEPE
ncbi:hypothetical protein D3C75_1085490 [compost metagenome]